jgi:hypothetical protein
MKKAPLLLPLLFSPAVALAAPKTFSELANTVVSILDSATGLLIVAGLVIYFYGISRNVLKMKDEGGQKMWNYVVWGVGVLFLMVSIWGILALIQNTLFGSDQYSPNTGQPAANFQVTQTFE